MLNPVNQKPRNNQCNTFVDTQWDYDTSFNFIFLGLCGIATQMKSKCQKSQLNSMNHEETHWTKPVTNRGEQASNNGYCRK